MTGEESPRTHRFADDDLVPIAALEHFSYCARQCALMYVEATFVDNVWTLRGAHVHERVHEERHRVDAGVRVEYGLSLVSHRYGLTGKSDVVEFRDGQPYPVEYKRGRLARFLHAELQVGAQALCLEEMLRTRVPEGAIFYASSQRRRSVPIDDELRRRVAAAADAVRAMLASGTTPPPVADKRCDNCSLAGVCLPYVVADDRRLAALRADLFRLDRSGEGVTGGG